jgi:hypothetical protein
MTTLSIRLATQKGKGQSASRESINLISAVAN